MKANVSSYEIPAYMLWHAFEITESVSHLSCHREPVLRIPDHPKSLRLSLGGWGDGPKKLAREDREDGGIGGIQPRTRTAMHLLPLRNSYWTHFCAEDRCRWSGCWCGPTQQLPPRTPRAFPTSMQQCKSHLSSKTHIFRMCTWYVYIICIYACMFMHLHY